MKSLRHGSAPSGINSQWSLECSCPYLSDDQSSIQAEAIGETVTEDVYSLIAVQQQNALFCWQLKESQDHMHTSYFFYSSASCSSAQMYFISSNIWLLMDLLTTRLCLAVKFSTQTKPA